ncbi:uncharacterized protein ACIQIH_014913 [Cyanocitta cristata]
MYLIFPIDPGVLSLPKEATLPVWGHMEGCPAPGGVCAHPARGCVPILPLCVCVCAHPARGCVPILLLGVCAHPASVCVAVCPSCSSVCVPILLLCVCVCAHPAQGCAPILLLCVCVCVPILLLGLCTHPAPLCVCVCAPILLLCVCVCVPILLLGLCTHPAPLCVCVCPSCSWGCAPILLLCVCYVPILPRAVCPCVCAHPAQGCVCLCELFLSVPAVPFSKPSYEHAQSKTVFQINSPQCTEIPTWTFVALYFFFLLFSLLSLTGVKCSEEENLPPQLPLKCLEPAAVFGILQLQWNKQSARPPQIPVQISSILPLGLFAVEKVEYGDSGINVYTQSYNYIT